MSQRKSKAVEAEHDVSDVPHLRDEEFRILVAAVSEYAIFRLDTDGRVVTWNTGAKNIKGYQEKEILGRHFSIFYTEEDKNDGLPESVLEKAAREGSWTGEGWRIRKDGSRFWAYLTVMPIMEEGELRGFVKVTRDMTERHRQEEELQQAKEQAERENALLQIMKTVAAAANDADSLDDAMRDALRTVCIHTGWPLGHVYRVCSHGPSEGGGYVLEPTDIWYSEDMDCFEHFLDVTRQMTFMPDEGLPGRVAVSGEPAWICDVTQDENFPRAEVVEDPQIRGAFGVPVHHGGEVVAVLEFFSSEVQEPDTSLLNAMGSVGVQLSRVAEREAAQAEIRRSEERYRRLFDEAQEGIAISTPDGRILDVNPATEEMLGYRREELLAMNAADLWVNPEERKKKVPEVARAGYIRNAELRARRKDGEEIVVEVSGTAHRGADGEVIAFQSYLREITDRKQFERALRESEAKFRQLTENAQIGIALIQDGVYQYVNPALAQISGYEREELIGESPSKLFQPSDRAFVEERVRMHLSGEVQSASREMNILTKEGEVRTLEMMGTHVSVQGKRTLIGTMHDVTERKRIEEALRESEAMFRALAEEAPVGVLLIQDGRLEYVNDALARMYGYERDELSGKSYIAELVHPSDRARVSHSIKVRISGERESMNFRFRGRKKNGETITIDAYGARIEYQGAPAIIGMDIDVTDRMHLQREVLNMQEEERRRLGRDLHDGVASQLTTIGLMIDLVSRRVTNGKIGIEDLPDHMKEIQDRVMKSGEDVRRLSRGLALSGLSGDDLPAALERLAQDLEGGHFENEVEQVCDDDTTAIHLYRVAQEAATNARKYAKADHVMIRLQSEEHGIALEIEDDGSGFDMAAVGEGSLGLRTMRYRAELLGGTLTIDSSPGAGTRVCCRVPR